MATTTLAALVTPPSAHRVRWSSVTTPSSTSTCTSAVAGSLGSSPSSSSPCTRIGTDGASTSQLCHVSCVRFSHHVSGQTPASIGWAASFTGDHRLTAGWELRPDARRSRARPGRACSTPATGTSGPSPATTIAVLEVSESDFKAEVLQSELPVLVDFWANWCGPCKLVAPLMDWAVKEYEGKLKVVKVEHDANPGLVAEYKVYGLPTIMLFKDGKLVPESHREGALTKVKLQAFIEEILPALAASA